MTLPAALIRPDPDSFDRALVREGRPRLDVSLARAQHDEYRRHLEQAGYSIEEVPSDEAHPDCVFIEDTAVIVGNVAVITRPGAEARRGEIEPVAQALAAHFPMVRIDAPGTLDGGDVFTAVGSVFVGRSERTNPAGIDQLADIAAGQGFDLIPVGVRDALHLKSAVLPVGGETVVVTPGAVDEDELSRLRIVYEAEGERHRFSALPLADGRLLVTSTAPVTAETLAALGFDLAPIDVSQIQAAEGGLTCMSILF